MYGIKLIAVLVVTGGIIAFIGDRLGTKIGKKRLSLFGLRPRHTSTIITILTGVLITTTTLGISAVISRDVRTMLFGMEQLNKDLQTSRERLYFVSQSLSNAQDELQNSQVEIESLQSEKRDLQSEQKELIEKNSELATENSTLTTKNSELATENSSLMEANSKLADENSNLTKQNSSLTETNSELSNRNSELSNQNLELVDANSQLESQKQNLQEGLITMRAGDIAFRAGEIIGSGVIAGGSSESEVNDKIESMTQNLPVWIYQPELDEATKIVAESQTDVVVRLVAAGNMIRGEPVRAELELYPNRKIFSAGEFIASKVIDIQSEGEIESLVMNFLREDVNETAQSRGILKDPIRNSVGVIEGDQFYEVVGALKKIHGQARISAYARTETDALGPLRLNIKVERIS